MPTPKSITHILAALLLALPLLARADTPATDTAPADLDPESQLVSLRKEWNAIPLDLISPKGFMRTLCKAIDDGDAKKLRSLLQATNPKTKPLLDIVPDALIIQQSLRKSLVARYGQDAITAANLPSELADDFEVKCMTTELHQKADGSWTSDSMPLIKDAQGIYHLDLDSIPLSDIGEVTLMLTGITSIDKKLTTLLHDNPTLTLEKFTQSAQTLSDAFAATAISSQPATDK